MTKRYTLRDRFGYWFDNLMAQGMWAKVKLLLGVTVVYVLVAGLIAVLTNAKPDETPPETLWNTLLLVMGKGVPQLKDGPPVYIALMFMTILYCLFFTAILISLINNGIRSKMDDLSKGQGRVLEEGHTLVLGFNEATFVLLEELIEANRNEPRPNTVVVLADADWQAMTDAIRARFGGSLNHPKTKVICRSGSVYGFEDLRRCALESCHDVVITSDVDFDVVRSVIACSHLLGQGDGAARPYLVSVFHGGESIVEASVAMENANISGMLEYLSFSEVLARVMVHTSRQPGLSDVFTELFNYTGHEFYIIDSDPAFPALFGKSVAEINLMLKDSFAVGVCAEGRIRIGAPRETLFAEGNSLIVVAEDDRALSVAGAPAPVRALSAQAPSQEGAAQVLVLGVRPLLDAVLREYANYLPDGSTVHVADSRGELDEAVSEPTRKMLERAGVALSFHKCPILRRQPLARLLDECSPDSVLVLIDHGAGNVEEDDEGAVRLLVYLREYRRRSGREFSITSEIHQASNKELVSMTGPDDFIVGQQMAALLMAQISQKREMAALFREILSSEGFEVYMKPASWYFECGEPVDLLSVGEAVADRGETLIGLRQKHGDRYGAAQINPEKYAPGMQAPRKYVFGADDYLVVLAESSGLSEKRSRR